MTHHELTMENKELKEAMMNDTQKDLVKKLLDVLFMDWKEEWRSSGCGSMDAHTGEVKNGNPLSCLKHEGCPCNGDDKLRSMFGTDELEELFNLKEELSKDENVKPKKCCGGKCKKQMSGFVPNKHS